MKKFLTAILLFVWGLGLILVGVDIFSYLGLLGNDTLNVISRETNVTLIMILIYIPSIIGFFWLGMNSMDKKK